MKIHNQLEPPLTAAVRPVTGNQTARRPLYHPAAVRRLGRVLRNRYRLESLLGMGAMGEVYRALDLQLEQPCAVKLVFPGAVFSLQAHRRFVNEAQVVARLFHPNIVEIRDFNEDADGTKFLVMELLEGQDLHELLSHKGRLPLSRAIEIVRSVGAALQYAHDLGIVHRDVKPNNIFLGGRAWRDGRAPRELGDGDGEQIKVLDFGLAKLLTSPPPDEGDGDGNSGAAAQLTQGIIIGTPAYLSPEATAMDSSGVDARSDQWSLAVVAYQLLSGRLPFGNPNPYQLCQMICSEEPPRLRTLVPSIPEHVDAAIHTALSKQRTDRFPKVLEFIRSLGNLPSLGRIDKDSDHARTRISSAALPAHPGQSAREPVIAEGGDSGGQCRPRGNDYSEPTQVEPYLPGLTRPRLALLNPGSVRQGSVPEFVEPDRELCSLRIPHAEPAPQLARLDEESPDPKLLVTAHYTAEQLVELSQMTSARDFGDLVQAAQDVPTAPYRFGTRTALKLDEEHERTPLPVPRPLLTEPSLGLQTMIAPPPEMAEPLPPIPEVSALTATLIPTGAPLMTAETAQVWPPVVAKPVVPPPAAKEVRATRPSPRSSTPPRPPREALAEPGQIKTVVLGPRAAATFAAFAGKEPAGQTFQTLHAAPSVLFLPEAAAPPARAAPRRTAQSPLYEPLQLCTTMLHLNTPPLLTLPGTSGMHAPELGMPLQLQLFTPPPRRTLWRAVGAGSVVIGLLVAVLLGLRLARAKAVSSGAPGSTRRAAVAPRIPTALPPSVQVAYVAPPEAWSSQAENYSAAQ